MSKINKSTKIILIIFFVFFILVASVILVLRSLNTYSLILKANWNINVPISYKEAFVETEEDDSIFGDGFRYRILKAENKTSIDRWLKLKPVDLNMQRFNEKSKAILDELKVPNDKRPKDIGSYFIKDKNDGMDYIMIFISKDKKTLYVVEDFL